MGHLWVRPLILGYRRSFDTFSIRTGKRPSAFAMQISLVSKVRYRMLFEQEEEEKEEEEEAI